jgi:hypothetical protein
MRAALLASLAAVTAAGGAAAAPSRAPATCRHQSSAAFPKSARNFVVGPVVLVGAGKYSSPDVIARFGGQKYPAVVLAGTASRRGRAFGTRSTSLFYADEHSSEGDGERTVSDGPRVVEFR